MKRPHQTCIKRALRASETRGAQVKVLIIEDERTIAASIGKGLAAQRLVVEASQHGDEAYALATSRTGIESRARDPSPARRKIVTEGKPRGLDLLRGRMASCFPPSLIWGKAIAESRSRLLWTDLSHGH